VTNRRTPTRYLEDTVVAALAVDPIDYGRRRRVELPLSSTVEGQRTGDDVPRLDRHDSALRVLLHGTGIDTSVDVRLDDPHRRYVPRRFAVTIPSLAALDAADDGAAVLAPALRLVRPTLFPGAAYDAPATATGIRGSARRDSAPLRWARVEAQLDDGTVVGRAHGDDRGEFLLLLGNNPAGLGSATKTLTLNVVVTGPEPKPVAASAAVTADPLWDLPLEQVPDPTAADDVMTGKQLPSGYDPGAVDHRPVEFALGRLLSETQPFEPVPGP
jgi:hypothetical protein